jgi:hypothetical protein
MDDFFETTFGPAELKILDAALEQWCLARSIPRRSPDAALAAEVLINLFREGNRTPSQLEEAASRHKWLGEGRYPTFADLS